MDQLRTKTDRELMRLSVEMEQALVQLRQQMQAVSQEILRRINEPENTTEKSNGSDNNNTA